MRNILILCLLILSGYLMLNQMGEPNSLSQEMEHQVSIFDLQSRPSLFKDSLVELKKLKIIETQSILNFSKSVVTDNSGKTMILISNHLYGKGEIIASVKGYYKILYRVNQTSGEFFIDESIHSLQDLLPVITSSLKI